MKPTENKPDKELKLHKQPQKHSKKRYLLLWGVDTIIVNNQPMTVTFPAEE